MEIVYIVLKGIFILKNFYVLWILIIVCKNIILIIFFLKFKNCNDGWLLKILICDKIWVYYLIWIINRNWWDVVFEKSKIFRENKEILEYKESVVIFFNRSGFCDNVGF